MKKILLLVMAISFSAVSAMAAEPLLLEPLSPAILSTLHDVNDQVTTPAQPNGLQVSVPGQPGVEASFATTNQMKNNMVPQNAAAQGKPVPQKRVPRVRIQTKQGTQGNTQWNPGGKGTKSFF